MEQFERIRRDYAREELSIRELAKRHGVHRRAVRQALGSAIPPPKRSPEVRPAPRLGVYRPVIDQILEADKEAPREQCHTARRIWQRLVEEHGAGVSERQVCRYVRDKRRELGEVGEVFVPLISGVFDVLRYDNLKSAVVRVLKGRRRVESDRFVGLRSHYRFDSAFCLPGQPGGS